MRASFVAIESSKNPASWNSLMLRHSVHYTCKVQYAALIKRAQPTFLQRWHRRFVSSLQIILGTGEASGFMRALSFGDRDVLTSRTEHAFQVTGLTHLLVVSGYQISLLFLIVRVSIGSLCRYLAPAFDSRILCFGCGVLASFIFVALIGFEHSNVRALLALVCFMAAALRESPHTLMNAVAVSFLVIIVLYPLSFFEPSVQLTFAALCGIALGAGDSEGNGAIRRYLYISVWASLCTSVVASAWFGTFSILGLVLNPLLGPVLSMLGCQGTLLGLFLYQSGIDANGLLLQLVSYGLELGRDVVVICAGLEMRYFHPGANFQLLLCGTVLMCVILLCKARMCHANLKYNI